MTTTGDTMTETQNHSDTDQGGTVRYHHADWVGDRDPEWPWRIWFWDGQPSPHHFSPEQSEAMGLTPPPPPPPEPDWDTLPVGSEVQDRHGDRWTRFHDGWGVSVGGRYPTPPAEYGPYTIVHRHEPEVTLEAALRTIGLSDTDIRAAADDAYGAAKSVLRLLSSLVRRAARAVVAEWDAK